MDKIGYDIVNGIIIYLNFNDILNFMIINRHIYNNVSNKLLQIKRIDFLYNYEYNSNTFEKFPNRAVCYICMKIQLRYLFSDNQWKKTLKRKTRSCINCLPKSTHFQFILICKAVNIFCFQCEKWIDINAFNESLKKNICINCKYGYNDLYIEY